MAIKFTDAKINQHTLELANKIKKNGKDITSKYR